MMRPYYDVNDVCALLGCKQTTAYNIMRKLNKELESEGYITVSGRVMKNYFNKRVHITDSEDINQDVVPEAL